MDTPPRAAMTALVEKAYTLTLRTEIPRAAAARSIPSDREEPSADAPRLMLATTRATSTNTTKTKTA